jgi:predicted Zn-dependent protease
MILAEKLAQKLNNLKSKNEIQDFFVSFDEKRSLALHSEQGGISKLETPTHYSEYSSGIYLIIWDEKTYSEGSVTNTSILCFDDFIKNARKVAREFESEIYIPERGIYPMVRTYSKALADMIDVPEYILKLADILDELDKMVKCKNGYSEITLEEGTKYIYSSKSLEEYYPYTDFKVTKTFKDKFSWTLQIADVFSIYKFQELLSFIGDIYNILTENNYKKLEKKEYDVVLPPNLFQSLFNTQVIENINGDSVLNNRSIFKKADFQSRAKVLGTLSLSYDPLQTLKRGSYRFTSYGVKPAKQYFIKFGKLDTPILNNLNYSALGYKMPTIELVDFDNLKFEGVKKKTFADFKKNNSQFLYIPDVTHIVQKNLSKHKILSKNSVLFEDGKAFSSGKLTFEIDLIDIIKNGKLEIIEFIDGQLGCKITGLDIKEI